MVKQKQEPIGSQQLHQEMGRASAMLVPYPDDGDALSKALWQVRYNLALCADTEPLPDLGAARKWLLIETMLAAAIGEQSIARAREAALEEIVMLARSMADFSRRHSAPYGFEVVGQGDMMALDKALAALAATAPDAGVGR